LSVQGIVGAGDGQRDAVYGQDEVLLAEAELADFEIGCEAETHPGIGLAAAAAVDRIVNRDPAAVKNNIWLPGFTRTDQSLPGPTGGLPEDYRRAETLNLEP